jgi:MFS family permease
MIMNRCHGFWSLGLMAGSAIIALFAGAPLIKLVVLALVTALLGVAAAWLLPQLPGDEETATPPRRRLRALPAPLIYVGLFMFFITLTEGAMADWSAVYLAERLGDLTVTERAGIAVTIFAGFMAGGRFLGDWLKMRMGAVALARTTLGTAFIGVVILVAPLPVAFAYLGFAMVGFGVSSGYPLGVSAIAALDDRYESANIALMAMVALGGFLVGPPLIGGIAEVASLAWGLGVLIPSLLLSLYLTRWLRPDVRYGSTPKDLDTSDSV